MTHPHHLVLAVMIVTGVAAGQAQSNSDMDDFAERYVKLVLAMGQHDSDYVDAFYGPAEWRDQVSEEGLPLSEGIGGLGGGCTPSRIQRLPR